MNLKKHICTYVEQSNSFYTSLANAHIDVNLTLKASKETFVYISIQFH